MRPFYRDAQPGIATSPTTRTYQDVILAFVEELLVQFLDLPCNLLIVRSAVVVSLYVDHVMQVVHDSVSEGIVGTQQQLVIRYGVEVFVQHLLGIDDRAYLQEVERTTLVLLAAHGSGKLNFYGTAHLLFSVLQHQLQDACQWEDIMLQDVGESDDLTSARIQSVANDLVVGVVGRGDVVQGTVLLGLLHMQFQQVEAVVDGEIVSYVFQVEGIEAGLCLLQGNFHFAGLQDLMGVIGREAESHSTVYDVFS